MWIWNEQSSQKLTPLRIGFLNWISLLYVIMVKRKVFCHFFGLWVGPSRMRCRHFKSESCARKNFVRFFARFSSPWSDICTTHASMTKKVRRGWDFFDFTKNHKIIKNGWSFPYLITFYVTEKNEAYRSDFWSALRMVIFGSLFCNISFTSWGLFKTHVNVKKCLIRWRKKYHVGIVSALIGKTICTKWLLGLSFQEGNIQSVLPKFQKFLQSWQSCPS